MSALKRIFSNHHKLQKHSSLPSNPDNRVAYLDLGSTNKLERSQSKPTTPVSVSTPTYKPESPLSGLPLTQSPTATSASSSKTNLRHGRSGSRAHAKHERAKSLDVRAVQSRKDSLERAERRKNSYENVGVPFFYRDFPIFSSSLILSGPTQSQLRRTPPEHVSGRDRLVYSSLSKRSSVKVPSRSPFRLV